MEHLWAPWRKAYIQDYSTPRGEIFARMGQSTDDEANLVFWRGESLFALLNRYPYNAGHSLIVPYRIVPDIDQFSEEESLESLSALRIVKAALTAAFRPQGFNIGLNLGAAAGAGIEQHLHWHIVPRWANDSNFITAVGGTRVHPNDLESVYRSLKDALKKI